MSFSSLRKRAGTSRGQEETGKGRSAHLLPIVSRAKSALYRSRDFNGWSFATTRATSELETTNSDRMEDCEEPATSWLLTRDSLYSDAIVNYPPNVAILRYFETLAAKSLVPYEAKNKFAPGLHDLLEQFISEDSRLTSELEQLLSLALQPEHLYAFDDSRIIPACMKLLETYCLENRVRHCWSITIQPSIRNSVNSCSAGHTDISVFES